MLKPHIMGLTPEDAVIVSNSQIRFLGYLFGCMEIERSRFHEDGSWIRIKTGRYCDECWGYQRER